MKTNPGKKKICQIIICLLVALFFWSVAKLSKINQKKIPIRIHLVNIPKEMSLATNKDIYIDVTAKGKSYKLLKYYWKRPIVELNYNDLQHISSDMYHIKKDVTFTWLQYPNLEIKSNPLDTLYLPIQKNKTRKLVVKPILDFQFEKEYRLSELSIFPDSISVRGIESVVDTMTAVYVRLFQKNEINKSFEKKIKLISTSQLHYDTNQILIKINVDKFVERIIQVKIEPKNVPEAHLIRLYPATTQVLCVGSFDLIKSISPSELIIEADYDKRNEKSNTLPLSVKTSIKGVKITLYQEKEVDYLMRKIE